jgi:hypothetical protein
MGGARVTAPDTVAGQVHVFFLFDVAQAIDLGALRRRLGSALQASRLDDKNAATPAVSYLTPPLSCGGDVLGVAEVDGFALRVKFFDYGVISLLLSKPFAGSWSDLIGLSQTLIESEPMEQRATAVCRRLVDQIRADLSGVRQTFLSEDYLVFALTAIPDAPTADEVLARHGGEIAQVLRGERQRLSTQERDEVLSHRLSYLADDLIVPAWNASFIFDAEPGTSATMEILEFANSQLLEFRYYDDLLDTELARLYPELQRSGWLDRVAGRRHTRAARRVQALMLDVNELTDRVQNAVKFVGDVFGARLLGNVATRIGVDRWKSNVDEKLKALDDIRRFSVEQAGSVQANTLELAIALICALELWLLGVELMR